MEKEKKKCSVDQFEVLVEFMERHKDFALGRCKSKEGRALAQRLWTELAHNLNSINNSQSSPRTAKEWAKYYTDYKARLNAKLRAIKASRTQTGGGPGDNLELSFLDTRLAAVLGHQPGEEQSPLEQTRHNPLNNLESEEELEVVVVVDEHGPQVEEMDESMHTEEEATNNNGSMEPLLAGTSHSSRSIDPVQQAIDPVQQALLDMGQKQAEANNRMAAAMNSQAVASERVERALELMAASFQNFVIAYKEQNK